MSNKAAKRKKEYENRKAKRQQEIKRRIAIAKATTLEEMAAAMGINLGPRR